MAEDFIVQKSFDEYRLDIWDKAPALGKRLKLFCNEKQVDVQSCSLAVLEQLLAHEPNSVVAEEAIATKVWGYTSAISNVDTHICVLRKVLKDRTRPHRIIGTVHARGYRFLREFETKKVPVLAQSLSGLEGPGDVQEAMREFFGMPTEAHEGVIILQSDLLDDLLKDSDPQRQFASPSSRLYKARTVVNTWDTYGATAIQEVFQMHAMKAPRLVLSDHHIRDPRHLSAPFKISMGLGFNDETTKTIQNQTCGPWMRISKTPGDAVSFEVRLLPSSDNTRLKWEPDSEKAGFFRLLPIDWDETYVDRWCRMLPPINGPEVQDYAMIFRHTRVKPQRQVLFVVAGFTERSTAIASHYLAEHWKQLWKTHVKNRTGGGSFGDFLIIIEGPSDLEKSYDWSEDETLQVTPEKLNTKQLSWRRVS